MNVLPQNLAYDPEILEKAKAIMQTVNDDFIDNYAGWPESLGKGTLDDTFDNRSTSSLYIESSCYYRNDTDASYHFNEAQSNWAAGRMRDCYADFKADFKLHDLSDDYGYNELNEELQREFEDYESYYFEPALLTMTLWFDSDKITLELDVNYQGGYYISTNRDVLESREFTREEFMALTDVQIEMILNEMFGYKARTEELEHDTTE